MDHPEIKPIVQWLDAITSFFSIKRNWVSLLEKQTEVVGAKSVLVVLVRAETRWSSINKCFERHIRLEQFITEVILADEKCAISVAKEAWEAARALLAFIEPIKLITDAVQSDTTTLLVAFERWQSLTHHLAVISQSVGHRFQGAAATLHDIVVTLTSTHFNMQLVASCVMLSMRPVSTYILPQNWRTLQAIGVEKERDAALAKLQSEFEEAVALVKRSQGAQDDDVAAATAAVLERARAATAAGKRRRHLPSRFVDPDEPTDMFERELQAVVREAAEPHEELVREHEAALAELRDRVADAKEQLAPARLQTAHDSLEFIAGWGVLFLAQFFPNMLGGRSPKALQDSLEEVYREYSSGLELWATKMRAAYNKKLASLQEANSKLPTIERVTHVLVPHAYTLSLWATERSKFALSQRPEDKAREIFCLIASALLRISSTEAAVERSFSLHKFVLTKLRNRASHDTVWAEMMIAFNGEHVEAALADCDTTELWFDVSDISNASVELANEDRQFAHRDSTEGNAMDVL